MQLQSLLGQAKIIPIFYGVEPSTLRYIEKGVYHDAFIEYEKKSSNLESKKIVTAVQEEVQRTQLLHVAAHPVALDKIVQDFERRCLNKLVQDFEFHCGMNEGEGKAQIVGVYGMGGVGKTTLCKELFNRKCKKYNRSCFIFDVREASAGSNLPPLQKKLLKDLFSVEEPSFQSREEGSNSIFNCIKRSSSWSFLIVLDDIDHLEQLDALRIMHMPSNSLVIITTQDEGVLIRAGIKVRYHLKEMDKEDAIQLFILHAFSQPHPATRYEDLVDAFLRAWRLASVSKSFGKACS
ncbi:hypothetical protein SUGI_0696540 [Cryptomeria japonica]|nr:hypothetical protein SUGI_0696540 [Cryptomeria japonica]